MISAWGSEGTDPTLASNFTYENTPANLNLTTSYASYSITANVDTSGCNNICVFIWSDVTDTTAGHFLYITDVQLEAGEAATSYDQQAYETEFNNCRRYFYKVQSATNYAKFGVGRAWSTDDMACAMYLPTPMRSAPTLGTSTIGSNFGVAGVGTNVSAITLAERSTTNQFMALNIAYGATSFSTGTIYQVESDNNTTSFVSFDSEL